jgi:hypothetical protein
MKKEDYYVNYVKGIKAENYFASLLNAKGVQYEYTNTWFDFTVLGSKDSLYMVEVKSTSLTHGSKPIKMRMGRFN